MNHFVSVQKLFLNILIIFLFIGVLTPKSYAQISTTAPELQILDTDQQYVPNKVIVQYKDKKTPDELDKKVEKRTQQKQSFFGWVQVGISDIGTTIKRDKKPETELESITEKIERNNLDGSELIDLDEKGSMYIYESSSGKNIDVKKVIEEFKSDSTVESAFPDVIIQGMYAPSDPAFPYQWHYPDINIPQAWDVTKGDASGNVIVAVMDTGISRYHSDLSGNILDWYDCRFVNLCYSNTGIDNYGHGTHVSGTVSAVTNNSILVSGVGHNTKIVSFKVLGDDNKGELSWLINGLSVLRQQYPNNKIIVNMSLGLTVNLPYFEAVINEMWNDGMILVAAAGNGKDTDDKTRANYPAGYANVISVAATQRNGTIAPYSYRGASWVDVAAPGGYWIDQATVPNGILSAYRDGGAGYMMGTSMATPHVSGVLALMWSINPNLSNTQIRTMLQDSAAGINGTGSDWKYGKIDALAGVNKVLSTLSTPTPTETLIPTPTDTPIPTNTPTNTPTNIPTNTPTHTPTWTPIPTNTSIPPSILTPSLSNTVVPSNTPTNTPTPTIVPQESTAPTISQAPSTTTQPIITEMPGCDIGSGDANCDGSVNSADFGCWSYEYKHSIPNENCESSDFNQSKKVDLLDFVIWRNTILRNAATQL